VAIAWGNKPVDKNQPSTTVNPSIIVRHIAVTNWMDTGSNEGSETFSYAPSMVQLSHLSILSPSPEGPGGHPTPPTILIVRSHLPNTPSQYNQDTHSIIDRWEIVESAQSVHPAFEQLNSRRNSQVSQPGTTISLRKTEGFDLDKVVIWLESIAFDRILCFAYSDGSFEYRQRSSMAELYTQGNQDRFTHLSQVGFTYADDEPCLQAALSPTFCSISQKGCDNKYRWKPLRCHLGDIGTTLQDPQYATIVAAFTLTCSTAIMTSINHDDLLAVASKYNKLPNFSYDWISEVSRVLKFGFDYSEETHHDTLIRNPSVQLSLSIQNSMGYRGDANRREFGGQMAWLILQLRNCVLLMTMTFSMKVPLPDLSRKVSGLEDAEAIRKIANLVRWSLDLMCWLVDSLVFPDSQTSIYETINGVTEGNGNPSIDLDALNSRLRATNNVALHILLSSAGRGFLTAVCRRIVHLDYSARKAMQTAAQIQGAPPGQASQAVISNELRASYTTIATLISVSIIPVRLLETFLTSIFTDVREAYSTAKLPYAQQQQPQTRTNDLTRNVIERGILLGGPLHPVMIPVISSIFKIHLPNLRAAIDPARVFFHKYDLLGLPDDSLASDFNQTESYATAPNSREENWRVSHTIDIFQRVPIVLGQEKEEWSEAARGRRWRRCARCAAVMEDITSTKPAVQFLIMQQRRCYCGGNWDLLQGKQTVA
jgi:mediator of RNA polymerase II transcription subunit 16